jgi:hypothetical protein
MFCGHVAFALAKKSDECAEARASARHSFNSPRTLGFQLEITSV